MLGGGSPCWPYRQEVQQHPWLCLGTVDEFTPWNPELSQPAEKEINTWNEGGNSFWPDNPSDITGWVWSSPKSCGPDGVTLWLTHPKPHTFLPFPPKTCSQQNPGVPRRCWVKIWIKHPCHSARSLQPSGLHKHTDKTGVLFQAIMKVVQDMSQFPSLLASTYSPCQSFLETLNW